MGRHFSKLLIPTKCLVFTTPNFLENEVTKDNHNSQLCCCCMVAWLHATTPSSSCSISIMSNPNPLDFAIRVCESIAFSLHAILGLTEPWTGCLVVHFETMAAREGCPLGFGPRLVQSFQLLPLQISLVAMLWYWQLKHILQHFMPEQCFII